MQQPTTEVLSDDEIISRLTWLAKAKMGQPLPPWLNNIARISELCDATLSYIERLKADADLQADLERDRIGE